MFGDWLKRQREARGWSQTYLAKQIGVTSQAVNQLEQGKNKRPSTEAAMALARVFGLTLEDVLLAAGLGGAHPSDEWSRALADATDAGLPASTVELYRDGYAKAPPEEQERMLRDLRRLVVLQRAAEEDPLAPLPEQAPAQEPGAGVVYLLAAESAPPRYTTDGDGGGGNFGARVNVAGCG